MADNQTDAVVAKELERMFGHFVAVDRISFTVPKGAIFGFLGPNGAGKSTTIRMLCGILQPTGGEGSVAGFDIRQESEKIKDRIGYMSQKFSLYSDLTVEENIDFYSGIYCVPQNKKQVRKDWALTMSGLREHRRTIAAELSTGWKQRLALGCAIIHEPAILFLDEPTSGVDPISRRAFWDLIYQLSEQGVTAFVTTHYMDEAEYVNRIGFIYGGRLVADGTPSELKNSLNAHILELACDRPEAALNILQFLPGIESATLFGRNIHLKVRPAYDQKEDLRKQLQQANIAVGKLDIVPPSLEDVFISLIDSHEKSHPTSTEDE